MYVLVDNDPWGYYIYSVVKQRSINLALESGLKYELDAPATKDFRYLTKAYLPRKLKEEDWLD